MGYTHYWKNGEIPQENWDAAVVCVKELFKKLPKGLIQKEWDNASVPIANKNEIRFNGVDDDGHETFCLARSGEGFSFCKTARKPYDVAVVAVLTIAKHYFGDLINVSSDGELEDWQEGLDLVKELFGFEDVPIS